MLQNLKIQNLTVFPDANLQFVSGLNVIVGENSCGKSHLLKVVYAMVAASFEQGRHPNAGEPTKSNLQKIYADKLLNVLRPESLGRLVRRKQGRERCELAFSYQDSGLDCHIDFASSSKTEVQIGLLNQKWQTTPPVFLPTRELLTLYPGFVSIYDSHYLEFDETYRDTCVLLGTPALKGKLEVKSAELLKPIEEAMGGKVSLDPNGRFYLTLPGQGNMEMTLVAEGMRKLAMLARLISTGALLDKGYLFWDEPEANLNPKLIKLIAKVILHLCKNGIQVFIATHSLFLVRELEILAHAPDFVAIPQRYFSLRASELGAVVEQGDQVSDLQTLVFLDEELSQSDRYLGLLNEGQSTSVGRD